MKRKESKLNKTGELGRTGLPVYGGRIYAEPLQKLQGDGWRKAVKDMTYNDPVIGAILFTIEMLARQVTWQINPYSDSTEDRANAQFAHECIFDDMEQTWQEQIAEILTMIPWGWSYFEMCYKRRGGESRDKTKNSRFSDGRLGFRKWAIRAQESLYRWDFDEFDDISAMVQMPAPDFRQRIVPYEKSMHFRTSSKMQNPEGWSILRNAYRPWYFKSNIENIEAIGIERDLAGFPVVDVPAEYLKQDAPPEEQELVEYAQEVVTKIRRDEMEGAVIPCVYDDKGHRLFDLRLLSTGGQRQFDTSGTINRWDQRIAICALADFVFIGSQAKGGSYALIDGKQSIFSTALSAWLDSVCDTVNRKAIPKLMSLNGRQRGNSPYMTHGKVDEISLKELGEYISKLSGAQVIFDEDQQNYLKRQADIPITEKGNSKD